MVPPLAIHKKTMAPLVLSLSFLCICLCLSPYCQNGGTRKMVVEEVSCWCLLSLSFRCLCLWPYRRSGWRWLSRDSQEDDATAWCQSSECCCAVARIKQPPQKQDLEPLNSPDCSPEKNFHLKIEQHAN